MTVARPLSRLLLSKHTTRICSRPRPQSCRYTSTFPNRSPFELDLKASRIPLTYFWYLLCLGIGAGAGLVVSDFAVTRLNAPKPGSEEDKVALRALADQMDRLDIVKKLRAQGYHLHSDMPLSQAAQGKGGWIELDVRKSMAETAAEGKNTSRTLTTKTLEGIQGLGVQRAFWNSETRELVAVVWIGSRLSGWPGMAHGGAIATIFEDAMARMIAGPNVSIDSVPTPTSMSVTYAKPTFSFDLYVLRASFSKPDLYQVEPPPGPAPAKSWLPYWKDFTKKWTTTAPESTMEISSTLESLDGEVKVRAKGTWPASVVVRRRA